MSNFTCKKKKIILSNFGILISDYETLRALDADNVPSVPSMSEEEINALPVHKYKIVGPQKYVLLAESDVCSWALDEYIDCSCLISGLVIHLFSRFLRNP